MVVRWGPVGTGVNGTVAARPTMRPDTSLAPFAPLDRMVRAVFGDDRPRWQAAERRGSSQGISTNCVWIKYGGVELSYERYWSGTWKDTIEKEGVEDPGHSSCYSADTGERADPCRSR